MVTFATTASSYILDCKCQFTPESLVTPSKRYTRTLKRDKTEIKPCLSLLYGHVFAFHRLAWGDLNQGGNPY